MDTNLNDWIKNSLSLEKIEPFMVWSAQNLGHIDIELNEECQELKSKLETIEGGIRFQKHMLTSQWWTIVAYELVRAINELEQKNSFEDNTRKILEKLLADLTKIRTPLAKFQKASGKNKKISQIAYPIWFLNLGVGWKLDNGEVFSRKKFGEDLLELLKSLN